MATKTGNAHNSSNKREMNQDIEYQRQSPYILGIWHSNETIGDAMRLKRKLEIQDGAHKTGSNDISARIQVSYENPKAIREISLKPLEIRFYLIYEMIYEIIPVWRPPYLISDFRLHHTVFVLLYLSSSSSKTWV